MKTRTMVAEAISGFFYETDTLRVRLNGHSMLPTLGHQQPILIQQADRLLVGDVIVFRNHYDQLIAHRFLGLLPTPGGLKLLTIGDNTPHPDPLLSRSQLVGKVVATDDHLPFRVNLGERLKAFRQWIAWSTILTARWLKKKLSGSRCS